MKRGGKMSPSSKLRVAPLRKHSRKARAFARELDQVRPLLLERSQGICEVCYSAPVEEVHHRLRRSQGGTNHLSNLLGLCSSCHDDIHSHPAKSYANGNLLRRIG